MRGQFIALIVSLYLFFDINVELWPFSLGPFGMRMRLTWNMVCRRTTVLACSVFRRPRSLAGNVHTSCQFPCRNKRHLQTHEVNVIMCGDLFYRSLTLITGIVGGTSITQGSRMFFAARTVLDQLPQVGDLVSLLSHLFPQLLNQGQQLGQSARHDICRREISALTSHDPHWIISNPSYRHSPHWPPGCLLGEVQLPLHRAHCGAA